MQDVIIETERLILRKLNENDFAALFDILGDPEVMRYSPRGPENEEGVFRFIEMNRQRDEMDGVAQWAVVLKDNDTCVGVCGISRQDVDGTSEFEVGFRFARQHWGQGYATEAATACRDFGFREKHFRKLISIIQTENIVSARVALKLGMTVEKDSIFHGIRVQVYSIHADGASAGASIS